MYTPLRQFELKHLSELQRFLGEARQHIEHCHYLHVGDITWQVFHMLAAHDPANLLRLVRDEQGQDRLAGFWLIYPDFGMFDIQLLPKFRPTDLEAAMLKEVQTHIIALNSAVSAFYTLVNEHDSSRKTLLASDGFVPAGDWLYMQHTLITLPEPVLAPGFKLADMTDTNPESRANALAEAFGGQPRPQHYRKLMQAPGYDAALDLVALAPDGSVAAFAMCWLDPVSLTGQFEPVGTVPEFRGQGLGKMLLLEGLRRMKQHGMNQVIVIVEAAEEPAVHLYSSVGFVPQWKIILYQKTRG